MSKKARKAGEHTGKCYKPTGGWAMRMRASISYKRLGSGKWTGPTNHGILGSHEVLGVMSYDPQLVVSYRMKEDRKETKSSICEQTSDIVTLPPLL